MHIVFILLSGFVMGNGLEYTTLIEYKKQRMDSATQLILEREIAILQKQLVKLEGQRK